MNGLSSLGAGLFAGIESLIVLAIIAVFAVLSSALQKRQRGKQPGPGRPDQDALPGEWDWPGQTSGAGGAPATPASSWEEELKRLLGQAPAEQPSPPPVVISAPPPPPPPVVVKHPGFPPSGHTAETHEACPTLETSELVVTPPVLGRLEESHAALASASRLEELVAARLQHATQGRVDETSAVHRPTSSREVVEVVAMFRSPRSARQAFIASQVFGAPRALESPPG